MTDNIVAQVGPYTLVKRAIQHGWIIRTPHCSFHIMHNGDRLCGSSDVQRLRSEFPHLAKWALIEINRYATPHGAQMSKDTDYVNVA